MKKVTKFGAVYGKTVGRIVPGYGVLGLVSCFLVNSLVYWGTQLLMANAYHYDFTTSWDRKIPAVKEWILIYTICYAFWAVNYIMIARESREQCFRLVSADIVSRIICGIFFILIPTTNVRPAVMGTDFCSNLLRFIYSADAPTNLFPSIHCLVSWFCYLGVRRTEKVPRWYQNFSLVFALLVCASTQFTKQHYLIDVLAGILIAEVCWYAAGRTKLPLLAENFFRRLNAWVLGPGYQEQIRSSRDSKRHRNIHCCS